MRHTSLYRVLAAPATVGAQLSSVAAPAPGAADSLFVVAAATASTRLGFTPRRSNNGSSTARLVVLVTATEEGVK